MTTTGQRHDEHSVGRGPCSRIACGHAESPDHVHGFDGVRTYCAVCGPEACPTYKAPSRRRCARCGVRENAHASLSGADLPHLQPGVCPWWVRPAPAPLRALTSTLRRFRF